MEWGLWVGFSMVTVFFSCFEGQRMWSRRAGALSWCGLGLGKKRGWAGLDFLVGRTGRSSAASMCD